jgi:uncharacterized Tic20 family protein
MPAVQDFFRPPAPGATTADHPLADPQVTEWERTYATFQHLTLLTIHALMPVIPALIMWLIKRERSPFVDDHGKESINFQISLVIYFLVGLATVPLCGMGGVLIGCTYVLGIVGMILAAIAANKGRYYRYPACIRLLH